MPSLEDQLSKLSGTSFVCIYMGLLMPSLGLSNQFETLSNTVAMTIFVITVVVNVCIQFATEVISSSFIVEHCIILCCMVLLLAMIWKATLDINFVKESPFYGIVMKKHRRASEKSMLERLMNLYEHGYSNNAQIVLNKQPTSAAVSVLCLVSLVVLMQALFRYPSTIMFPKAKSDYSWSIWPIVVTQTAFVAVGCAITCFRWYSLSDYVWEYDVSGREKIVIKHDMSSGSMFPFSKLYTCRQMLTLFIDGLVLTCVWIIKPVFLLFGEAKPDKYHKDAIHTYIQVDGEFKRYKPDRSHRDFELWCKDRCMRNIQRWMGNSDNDPLIHLKLLLSRISPSRQPLMSFIEKRHAFNLSILSVTVLVRTVEVAFPSHLSTTLMEAFREVFVFVDFIESKINPGNKRKARFARALWKGPGFDIPISIDRSQSETQLAVDIIEKLRCDHLEFELYSVRKYITNYQSYCTIQELYDEIEQLFVNILHFYLSLLPIAIHKDITEGPDEELEEKAKAALKLVSKMGPLEDHIKWSFPETEHPISHLTAPIRFIPGGEDWSPAQANNHFNGTASSTLADVIQNV